VDLPLQNENHGLQVASVGSHDSPKGTGKNEEKGGKTHHQKETRRTKQTPHREERREGEHMQGCTHRKK
jgi:hypothetical protein